jgi:tRNA nucleotidyltransferase/poly(A) polymerase
MTAPQILSRAQHAISRKNMDPDAVRVLYRLYHAGFLAYLVGGGTRDLLLGRRPKDFDISTSAHPQQVKKLFRNCFVVGRRFRLCHVRFGKKVIEVSTFRRKSEPEEGDTLIRRDNTFGTAEEDAFRRDFTVNALFYDIGTFSVIDYVNGLEDLRLRVIRTIGEPGVRFREDPVRMLRAVALGARLGFTIEPATLEAIRALRGEIVKSSSARILEEMYKILRQGAARETFVQLHDVGLLAYLLPEADRAMRADGEALLASLGRLDAYRNAATVAAIEGLTNPVLMGSVLVPLNVPLRRGARAPARRPAPVGAEGMQETDATADDLMAEIEALDAIEEPAEAGPMAPLSLPFARRDLDRLRLILIAQRRLHEPQRSVHGRRIQAGRHYFPEALLWMEIHGGDEGRALVAQWRHLDAEDQGSRPADETQPALPPPRGRRRRRRRRPPRPTI